MPPNINSGQPASHGMATNDRNVESKDFFQAQVADGKESLAVMKKLTAISISTILYHRNMFPESDYGQRTIRDQVFHILDKEARTTEAREVVSLVQSLFKPITQKYLKSVMLGFCEDTNNTNELVEAYTFHYNYTKDEVSVSKSTRNTPKSSVSLGDKDIGDSAAKTFAKLKKICQSQALIDRQVYMTMQLRYTDDTPEDYEPPKFSPGLRRKFSIAGYDVGNYMCGAVNTPFHGFKLQARLPKN